MTLYHFTAEQYIESIQDSGLMYGRTTLFNNRGTFIGFFPVTQWLTSNKSFSQEWDTDMLGLIQYSRTEARIEIHIPPNKKKYLHKWEDVCKKAIFRNSAKELNSFGDPHNWYIYLGVIPSMWIKNITYKRDLIEK